MKSEQRKEILELLQSGKITADEAAEMLTKAAEIEPEPITAEVEVVEAIRENAPAAKQGGQPATFKVRVSDRETGKNKVTVNIPLRMLKFGLKLGGRFAPELEGLDLDELNGMMHDMQSGLLVEVDDEESNEQVRVYIE